MTAVNIFAFVADQKIADLHDITPHLLGLQQNIVDHKFAKDYDYHRIPAPWLQISILRILGSFPLFPLVNMLQGTSDQSILSSQDQ